MLGEVVYSNQYYQEWVWQEMGNARVIICEHISTNDRLMYRVEFYDNHGYSVHVAAHTTDAAIAAFNALVRSGAHENQPRQLEQ
jgi:hypothetical protein